MDWKRAGVLALLVLSPALAGCLGDDEVAADVEGERAEEAVATEATGSITGQIVTNDLEVLGGVEIGLSGPTGPVATTASDQMGRFTFNDLEPARYRMQVAAACCRAYAKDVDVQAGEVTQTSAQLTRLTDDDLQVPYLAENDWNGFIACSVGTPVLLLAVCSIAGDPNDDFLHDFVVRRGLTQLVVAMDWQPAGGVSGESLALLIQNRCPQPCSHEYRRVTGPPPLEAIIEDETTIDEDAHFSLIEEELGMRYRIFTGGSGVTYQQGFNLYWYEWYYSTMPEGFQTVPDS